MSNPIEWWLAETRPMFEDLVAYAQTIDHPLAAWFVREMQDPNPLLWFAVFYAAIHLAAFVRWLGDECADARYRRGHDQH